MRMYDVISKKRDGKILSKEEINYFINGYVNKEIPDYQVSALLMAIYLNGMTDNEISNLTEAIVSSGDRIDLSKIKGVTLDKHSTGGVGDKTTLVIAPIIACLGGSIAKMSGKGLGHTGGTIDKLQSIPGFLTNLTNDKFYKQVNDIGISLIGQTGNLTPGDKLLYSLRDATATVESIPLIASSIMSKKIAAGADCILLDVKTGSGAFMKTVEDSTLLAHKMVKIGNSFNKKVIALITNMDEPLGYNIGNSLEVIEAIEVLKNRGPEDLRELCISIAANMLTMSTDKTLKECEKDVIEVLENGKALNKFKQLIAYQGGKTKIIDDYDLLPIAKDRINVYAIKTGYINKIDTEKVGIVSCMLGAGRNIIDDCIDYGAGIVLKCKINDYVTKGDVIATLYTSNNSNTADIIKLFLSAYSISSKPVDQIKLIYKTIK